VVQAEAAALAEKTAQYLTELQQQVALEVAEQLMQEEVDTQQVKELHLVAVVAVLVA
jgi:hypothetical protein